MSRQSASTSLPGLETERAELIRKLKAEYSRADEACKRVQVFRDQAGIPAINEMRYAGYHLAVALSDDGIFCDLAELRRALAHCQRATYEAAEAGLLIALREVDAFKNDYKLVAITDVVKEWHEILETCQEAQNQLENPRLLGDERAPDHERHKELFDRLVPIVKRLESARPELNKKMAAERRLHNRFVITVCLSITAMLIAIIVALTR